MNATNTHTDCKTCRTHMPELLLDDTYAAQHPELSAHMANCTDCAAELHELRETMAMMDAWTAPEPSPYFDSKMHVLLREEQTKQPEGLWERTKSFLLFSTGRTLRPAVSGALACAMLIGAGTFGLHVRQAQTASSATVNDLKILDNNAQALQQMDQMLDDSDDSGPPPVS